MKLYEEKFKDYLKEENKDIESILNSILKPTPINISYNNFIITSIKFMIKIKIIKILILLKKTNQEKKIKKL